MNKIYFGDNLSADILKLVEKGDNQCRTFMNMKGSLLIFR